MALRQSASIACRTVANRLERQTPKRHLPSRSSATRLGGLHLCVSRPRGNWTRCWRVFPSRRDCSQRICEYEKGAACQENANCYSVKKENPARLCAGFLFSLCAIAKGVPPRVDQTLCSWVIYYPHATGREISTDVDLELFNPQIVRIHSFSISLLRAKAQPSFPHHARFTVHRFLPPAFKLIQFSDGNRTRRQRISLFPRVHKTCGRIKIA